MPQNIAFGPRIRKSPFFEATQSAGVSHFSIYNKMYFPVSYGDPLAEYERLVNGVAMWDVAVERQVKIKGPDALELVRILTPRNLEKVNVGQGRYVPICDHRGTLINDPVLLPISEDEYWLSIADNDLILWTRAIAYDRNFRVDISEPDVSPLAVQGPLAKNVMIDLFGDWIDELKYFGFRYTIFEDMELFVARSGWSKQGGYEIYLTDGSRGMDLWNAVALAGAPYGIGPGAPNYIERIESGLLSLGADTDDDTNPFELGLGKMIDLDQKADFIGKEALKRIHALGPLRELRGFIFDGEPFKGPNEHRWPVTVNGMQAGHVSAGAYSPRLKKNIGMGLVATHYADNETLLIVETEHGERTATVTQLPFEIPKSADQKKA